MDATTTWILVADGSHARLFCQDGSGSPVRELPHDTFDAPDLKAREADRDKPGRAPDVSQMAPGRHAYEPRTDPHDKQRHRLMKEVMDDLNRHAQRNDFDRLIVCAPPQAMGSVREVLPKPVKDKVVAEETKDYTGSGEADLEKHLQHLLPVDPQARRYQENRRPGPPPSPNVPGGSRH